MIESRIKSRWLRERRPFGLRWLYLRYPLSFHPSSLTLSITSWSSSSTDVKLSSIISKSHISWFESVFGFIALNSAYDKVRKHNFSIEKVPSKLPDGSMSMTILLTSVKGCEKGFDEIQGDGANAGAVDRTQDLNEKDHLMYITHWCLCSAAAVSNNGRTSK